MAATKGPAIEAERIVGCEIHRGFVAVSVEEADEAKSSGADFTPVGIECQCTTFSPMLRQRYGTMQSI
jgi:hypothetical protein